MHQALLLVAVVFNLCLVAKDGKHFHLLKAELQLFGSIMDELLNCKLDKGIPGL